MSQLQQDLQALHAFVRNQWNRTHCLLLCMNDVGRADGTIPPHTGADTYENTYEMYLRRQPMVRALGFPSSRAMFDWNDETDRTKDEVIARVEQALAAVTPEPVTTIQELMTTARDLAFASLSYA